VHETLLGLVGLLLAFGMTMAVGRYDTRRSLVVQESNDIGTTFLRAQMLAEPSRATSLALLEEYADTAVDLADEVPDTERFDDDVERIAGLHRELWAAAGDALRAEPSGTAPRLYIETLNSMIDTHNDRVTSTSVGPWMGQFTLGASASSNTRIVPRSRTRQVSHRKRNCVGDVERTSPAPTDGVERPLGTHESRR
jgi:hypothetical protein